MGSYVIAPDTHCAINSYPHNLEDIPRSIFQSSTVSICVKGFKLAEAMFKQYFNFLVSPITVCYFPFMFPRTTSELKGNYKVALMI